MISRESFGSILMGPQYLEEQKEESQSKTRYLVAWQVSGFFKQIAHKHLQARK